jgi:hypothetical protein
MWRNIFLLCLCCANIVVQAQLNSNYWSHQYGTKGLLLNGAVIANVDDETAIFYNPGAFALYDHTGVSLSLVTPSYSYIRTNDFLGDETSFSDQKLELAPGLVAASFKPFKTDRLIIGLTIFSRFESSIAYDDRVTRTLDGGEFFLGELQFERNITERWAGAAISYQLAENLSFGISQFVTFRNESLSLAFKKDILSTQNPENIINGWQSDTDYNFSINGGLRTKFGLVWKPGDLAIGLTYTLPLDYWMYSAANYRIDDRKVREDQAIEVLSNFRRIDINDYKTPASFGIGVSFLYGETQVSISAEYFRSTDSYRLISDQDDPYDGQSTTVTTTNFEIRQNAQEVLNFAIGCQQPMKNGKHWFYGFRTDLSPQSVLNLGEDISFLALTPDIFHVSTGIESAFMENSFSVGIDYGFGFKGGGQQFTNISNVNREDIFSFSGESVVDTYSQQVSMFLIYDF